MACTLGFIAAEGPGRLLAGGLDTPVSGPPFFVPSNRNVPVLFCLRLGGRGDSEVWGASGVWA